MASKFDIQIMPAPGLPQAIVQVIDHDQDETTDWYRVDLPCAGLSLDHILARAYLQHPPIKDMLDMAAKVAYAIYLNEEGFDIHAFLPQVPALVSQSGLAASTPPSNASTPVMPRM